MPFCYSLNCSAGRLRIRLKTIERQRAHDPFGKVEHMRLSRCGLSRWASVGWAIRRLSSRAARRGVRQSVVQTRRLPLSVHLPEPVVELEITIGSFSVYVIGISYAVKWISAPQYRAPHLRPKSARRGPAFGGDEVEIAGSNWRQGPGVVATMLKPVIDAAIVDRVVFNYIARASESHDCLFSMYP